ncbi:MAG: ATP-dependent helicase [Eubacteriaceae bacterium]|jgi:DNA helicase-2/ATP-dependent DNA helicase PcrA
MQELEQKLDNFTSEYGLMLNGQQKQAVLRTRGETLLLAVPGSGKTTVIIARTAFMIRVLGVDPRSILSLTFSRAGARDLKKRYLSVYGEDQVLPKFSTIHSFALSVIRYCEKRMKRKAFGILENSSKMISEVYQSIKGQKPSEADLADLAATITYAKNLMLSENEIEKLECGDIDFAEFYSAYEAAKKKNRVMDFDDLLIYAWRLLSRNKILLDHYKERYPHINIDEAQDTSRVQHEIIRLLADGCESLFMVGDEDQSIYGFRGAYPEGLLSFKEYYPKGKILLMETNFRSTGKLVRNADRFIGLNEGRYDKHIRTDNPEGLGAEHEYFKTQEEMYHYILESVRRERKDTAVLYRNNESVLPLIDLFEREGEPYSLKEHNPLFFSNFLIRDIRDFVRFAEKPDDFEVFTRIYYKMSASISRGNMRLLAKCRGNVLDSLQNMNIPDWLYEQVDDIRKGFKKLPGQKPADAIRTILYEIGYMDFLEYRIENGIKREYITQKLDILRTLAGRESTLTGFFDRLGQLRRIVIDPAKPQRSGPVFTTIHSAKGLEFEKVMMMDLYDSVLPASLQGTPEEVRRGWLEEVRLFYVGVTRAKRELIFLSLGTPRRQPGGKEDSPFIPYYLKPGKKNRPQIP